MTPFVFVLLVALLALPLGAAGQQMTIGELMEVGETALEERRFPDALAAFESITRRDARNVTAWYGVGMAAFMLGRNGESESALARAVALAPDLLDASLMLGELQYRRGRLTEAIATYEAALKWSPGDRRLTEAITRWRRDLGVEGRFIESRGAHFRVTFEGPEDQALARRAVEMLEAAYLRAGSTLRVYPSETIEVVFYTLQQFRDISRMPSWSAGAFDGRIRVPIRGATNSLDELQMVLQHEFIHALVASVGGPTVPLWLNEGLATVFEGEGLTWARQVLAEETERIPLLELHRSFTGRSETGVRVAYAQSAIAVAKMLEHGAPSVINLLRDIASGASFDAAFHRRIGTPYRDFQQTIARE